MNTAAVHTRRVRAGQPVADEFENSRWAELDESQRTSQGNAPMAAAAIAAALLPLILVGAGALVVYAIKSYA